MRQLEKENLQKIKNDFNWLNFSVQQLIAKIIYRKWSAKRPKTLVFRIRENILKFSCSFIINIINMIAYVKKLKFFSFSCEINDIFFHFRVIISGMKVPNPYVLNLTFSVMSEPYHGLEFSPPAFSIYK